MAEKPRLAVSIGAYEYGGQGTVVQAELSFFRERYATTLVAERIERSIPRGVETVEMSSWGQFGGVSKALVDLFRGFDLVHCIDSLGLMRAALSSGAPVVVTSMGIAPPTIRADLASALRGVATILLYPRLYRSADAMIAISGYIGQWLREFAHVEARVILLGTEAPDEMQVIEPPVARNALYVGEVTPRKGLSDLLRGIVLGPDDVGLDVVGRGDIARYGREAEALGIANRVRFHGVLSKADLDAKYRSAHCTVTASFWEGFGLPILEGFRFGRPAVARRQGGMRELIELSGAGRNFDDPSQLGACIDEVTQEWDELARRALDFAAAHTWETTFEAYAKVFEEVLEAR
jgi:glycosyltransferase involved in cell wall biosynthesis